MNEYTISIMINNECNLRCKYCYVRQLSEDEKNFLNIERTYSIIRFLIKTCKTNDKLIFNFIGGEPLLNYEVIDYFIKKIRVYFKNTQFMMTTNGLLLNNKLISKVIDNFYKTLTISLDGDMNTHLKNRIGCSAEDYKTLLNNALILNAKMRELRIRMTITKETIEYLFSNIKYLINLGFNIIVPVLDFTEVNYDYDDIRKLNKEIDKIKLFFNDDDILKIKFRGINGEIQNLNKCDAGYSSFCIDSIGDIYPCSSAIDKDLELGDIYKGIDLNKVKSLNNINNISLKECEGCVLYEECLSPRCKLINYVTMGDYFIPNLAHCIHMNAIC